MNNQNYNNFNNQQTGRFTPNGYVNPNPVTQGAYEYNNQMLYNNAENLKKINEKRNIRKVSNLIGVGFIIFIALSTLASIIILIPIMFTGAYDLSKYSESGGIEPVAMYLLNAIICLLGFGIAGIAITKMCGLRLDEVIHIKSTDLSDTIMLVVTSMCFVFGFNILLTLMNLNLSLFGGFENEVSNYGEPDGLIGSIIYFVAIAIIPPIIEEFIFRGAILGILQNKFGDALAIIVSGALFGLMHANFVQTPVTFLTGLILGYLTVKTNSIIPSIILHCLNNSIAVISEFVIKAINDDAISSLFEASLMLAFVVLGLIFAAKLIKKHKNSLFNFNKKETSLTMSEQLICVFTSPCIIIFLVYCLFSCIVAANL